MASQRRFRAKIDWPDLIPLFAYVAFFGALVVTPVWSTLVLRESGGGLMGVVGVVVGLTAFVVLWRYLGRPVRPEDEPDDLVHRRGWERPDPR